MHYLPDEYDLIEIVLQDSTVDFVALFAVHSIDIWNVIESFRENGLNTLEHQSEINITRLEALISNLYHNLNKRLPSQQQVSVESLSSLMLNWLLSTYGA